MNKDNATVTNHSYWISVSLKTHNYIFQRQECKGRRRANNGKRVECRTVRDSQLLHCRTERRRANCGQPQECRTVKTERTSVRSESVKKGEMESEPLSTSRVQNKRRA
jgi:hypothetical protein